MKSNYFSFKNKCSTDEEIKKACVLDEECRKEYYFLVTISTQPQTVNYYNLKNLVIRTSLSLHLNKILLKSY